MQDPFFTKKHCDRCGAELTVRTMSMFNEDVICMVCKAAIRNGKRNFKGIGLKKHGKADSDGNF